MWTESGLSMEEYRNVDCRSFGDITVGMKNHLANMEEVRDHLGDSVVDTWITEKEFE
jgi:hypothetical protein